MDKAKLYSDAEKCLAKNQLEKALNALESILRVDHHDVKALNKSADILLKSGKADKAIDYLKRVGEVYTRDGFFSKAIAIYKRILKLDREASKPELILIHEKLADLYAQLGLVSDAMNHFAIVVDYYDQASDRQALLQVLKKVSDLDPYNVENQLKLAELFLAEEQFAEATETFQRVKESAQGKGNIADVIRIQERWLALTPKDVDVLKGLVDLYLQNGEPKKALGKIQSCFRSDPHNAKVLELLSETFMSLRQTDKARAVDVELLKVYKKNGELEKAEALEEKLNRRSSIATSIPKEEQERLAQENESKVRIKEDAIDPAEQLIKSSQMDADEKKLLSECDVYLKYGLADKAREALLQQVQKFPQSLPLRWKLKFVYQDLGAKDDAAHCLSEIVMLGEQLNQKEWVELAKKELQALEPSHAALGGSGQETGESSSDFDESGLEAMNISSDSEEISIIVDEDDMDEEISLFEEDEVELQPEPAAAAAPEPKPEPKSEEPQVTKEEEANEPSEIFDLVPEESSQQDFDFQEEVEDLEPLELSESSPKEEAPVSEPEEIALEPHEAPGEEAPAEEVSEEEGFGGEALLTEADFSEDELASLSQQLDPEAKAIVEEAKKEESKIEKPTAAATPEPEQEAEVLSLEESAEEPEEKTINLSPSAEEKPVTLEPELLVEKKTPKAAEKKTVPGAPEIKKDSSEAVTDDEFEVQQGLEEVAFFKSQGLEDEASRLIATLKEKFPNYHGWSGGGKSGAKAAAPKKDVKKEVAKLNTLGRGVKVTVQEDERSDSDEDFFDLGSAVFDELGPEVTAAKDEKPAEVQDVFNAFKEGVAQTVSSADFQTHFDLGIAYREMGLIDDAVAEFKLVSQVEGKESMGLHQMALCEMSRKQWKPARAYLEKALEASPSNSQEKMSLDYDLGEVLLELNEKDKAKTLFESVQSQDPEFRSVGDRVKQVST